MKLYVFAFNSNNGVAYLVFFKIFKPSATSISYRSKTPVYG